MRDSPKLGSQFGTQNEGSQKLGSHFGTQKVVGVVREFMLKSGP